MKLLALTDVSDGKTQEFVVVEKIQHIQPFHQEVVIGTKRETRTTKAGFIGKLFGQKDETYEVEVQDKKLLTGATIYMDNGHGTHVLETPENIAGMLVEGNFLTVEKGE